MKAKKLFMKILKIILGVGGVLQLFQMVFPKEFIFFMSEGKDFVKVNWLTLIIVVLLIVVIMLLRKNNLPPGDETLR